MDEDQFYSELDFLSDGVSWENIALPDVWCPTGSDDHPLLLVTYDRNGGRRVAFRPFGSCTDCDQCVRLLRMMPRTDETPHGF